MLSSETKQMKFKDKSAASEGCWHFFFCSFSTGVVQLVVKIVD